MDELQKGAWIRTLWDPVKAREESPLIGDKQVKVAAYCRVSSDSEIQTHSLMNQVKYYTHYIREKPNWHFSGVYYDLATSGKDVKKQTGLQRLLRHAEEKRVEFIIVKNVSRLSRNAEQLISIVQQLSKQGVGVYFEEQKLDTSLPYNQFLLSTYAALAQEEIENASNAIRWGHQKRSQQGKAKYAQLYGYDKVNEEGKPPLEINQEEAPVVRQIFDWYLQGWRLADITRALMDRGVKTKRGKDVWHSNTIKAMLQTVTYTGNKIDGINSKQLFPHHGSTPTSDHVWFEKTHPAIITMEVFEKAQERLEKEYEKYHKKSPRQKAPTPKPFDKRVICYRCGYGMGQTRTTTGVYRRCYPGNLGKCEAPRMREEELFHMLLEALKIRFSMTDETALITLTKVLKRTNTQDHFEFHRLKWLSEIEIARETGSEIEALKLEEDFQSFERHIEKIEEDRPFRLKALEWMNTISTIEAFYDQLKPEHLRAWVLQVYVYSLDRYEVTWLDGTKTTIGDALPEKAQPTEKPVKGKGNQEKTREKEVMTDLTLLDEHGNLLEKGDKTMKPLIQRDVQKIEPNEGEKILDIIYSSNWGHTPTETTKKQPLRTAAYCRVSTDKEDQAGSLKQQIAYYTYYIMKEPKYEFAGIFVDDGISGRSMKKRTGLQKLIKACEANEISLIICKSISRLSRNIVDVLEISRYLASLSNPVYIYFEREGIHTGSKEGDLMLSIFGGIAQEESMNLGNIIAWGVRAQAKRGIIRRGKANYGYQTDDKYRWHIVEEEARVVRRIYEEAKNGKSSYGISVALSEERVPTPEKKLNWNSSTIDRILTSVIYRGDYLFQQYVNETEVEKKTVRNEGQEPQYYIENHHEPIIDSETWEEVQMILERRRREFAERNAPVEDIGEKRNPTFESKMYCGKCGTHLIRVRNRRMYDKKVYHSHYWVCRRKGTPSEYINNACSTKYMQQRYFEEHFIHFLQQLILQLSMFEEEAMKWITKVDLSEEEQIEEQKLQQEMIALNQVLYETVNEELQEQGWDSRQVDRITETLSQLYEKQKLFQERKEQAAKARKDLTRLIRRLKQYEKEPTDSFPVEVYQALVIKAVVYEDGRIHYHCPFGVEWTTDKRYAPYIQKLTGERKDRTKKRHEEIRNSSEVAELMEYCKEPRIWREIMQFINERMFISSPHLENVVIKPFMKEGKMERFMASRPNEPKDLYHYRFIDS